MFVEFVGQSDRSVCPTPFTTRATFQTVLTASFQYQIYPHTNAVVAHSLMISLAKPTGAEGLTFGPQGDANGSPDGLTRARSSPAASVNTGSFGGTPPPLSGKREKKNIPVELTAYGTTPSGKPRLFVCQVCTRAFARLEHLRRHERSHTKEKPFSCGVCQRKFSRRDLLLRHAQKLHAGCTDAITRLRRKLMKRLDSMSHDFDMDMDVDMMDDEDESPEGTDGGEASKSPSKRNTGASTPSTLADTVNFNVNLFNYKKFQLPSGAAGSAKSSRTNLVKDSTSLKRQMFDRRQLMGRSRGASFSAQSGANYSIGLGAFNESVYPDAENIEFSTPQMLPSSTADENNWLNNLSTIPGLSADQMHPTQTTTPVQHPQRPLLSNAMRTGLKHPSITPLSLGDEVPMNVLHHGSFSGGASGHVRSDSVSSIQSSSFTSFDPMGMQYMMPEQQLRLLQQNVSATGSAHDALLQQTATSLEDGNGTNNGHNNPNPLARHNMSLLMPEHTSGGDYGYLFYDIPESMLGGAKFENFRLPMGLSTIKQEDEEELQAQTQNRQHGAMPQGGQAHRPYHANPNFDATFLNDIGELAHEYDVNSKFMPNGYSFYGDKASVSSSGVDTSSPHNSSTPQSQQPGAPSAVPGSSISGNGYDSCLNQSQLMNMEGYTLISPQSLQGGIPAAGMPPMGQKKKPLQFKPGNYNKNKLFTSNMRYMINRALIKYPISGIMTPSIPSNEKLEFYLSNFGNIFLSHFPFIHILKLNEYEIMNVTLNEELSNESARVCLPLLVATIGALLTNNKNDSEHLYEASRRTIHIYLESRKNAADGDDDKKNAAQSTNPLWLIQLLTLSVIYGLFSDNENNVYIIIRQLNALNLLVKTSIKSGSEVLFSIYGEDLDTFQKCTKDVTDQTTSPSKSLFAYDASEELKFKNNINIQLQKRIVFMIYRLTTFLLMMYNVPLTLSINDLGMLDAPNKFEEHLWNFRNFQHFQEHRQLHNGSRIGDILSESNANKIIFREALLMITKNYVTLPEAGQSQAVGELDAKLKHLSLFGFISIVHSIYEIKQYQEMKRVDVFVILDNLTRFIGADQPGQESLNKVQEDFEKLDYALLANFTKVSSLVNIKLVKEQSWLRKYDELSKNFDNLLMNMNSISDHDYLRVVDCCIVILKLVLFKTEDARVLDEHGNVRTAAFHDLVNDSLVGSTNTTAEFEKLINLKIFDEFDNLKASIHSQMLFHVFTVLSLFLTFMLRRTHFKNNGNHIINEFQTGNEFDWELNQRFEVVLKILGKVEAFLKEKYENLKLDNDFANLYLYSSTEGGGFNNNSYTLEKLLYILKIGELILGYMHDTNIKVCIFQKLSGSLSQLRKFMIDNEARILS